MKFRKTDSSNQNLKQRGFFRRFLANSFMRKDIVKLPGLPTNFWIDRVSSRSNNTRILWDRQFDFVICCLCFTIGITDFWRFPLLIYQEGGSSALLIYYLSSIFINYPLVLMEMALGQFSSRSCITAFKIVPLFGGLGVTQLFMTTAVLINYSIVIAWCLDYFLGTFYKNLPWSHCNHTYNSVNCLGSFNKLRKSDFVSSSEEYYYKGLLVYHNINGTTRSIHDNVGLPNLNLSIDLFLVWLASLSIVLTGLRPNMKIIYAITILPLFVLFLLTTYILTLPGTYVGITHYLYFNATKLYDITVYKRIIEYSVYSLGPTYGIFISFSSFNGFHHNFYRDATILFAVDAIVSFFNGMMVFSLVSHQSWHIKKPFRDIIKNDKDIFFITITDALARLEYGRWCTMAAMLSIGLLALGSHVSLLNNITTSLYDHFAAIRHSKWFKFVVECFIALLLYVSGLIFVTPGGLNWFFMYDAWVVSVSMLLVCFLECVIIGSIYGFFHFRFDLRMMMGFSMNMTWLVIIGIFNPILFLVLLIIYCNSTKVTINNIVMPTYAVRISEFLVFIIFCPMLINAAYLMYKSPESMKNKLMLPPETHGPYYRAHWLLDIMYIEKLLRNKTNPEFLLKVSPDEDFEKIIDVAKKIQTEFETPKTRKKFENIDKTYSKDSSETNDF